MQTFTTHTGLVLRKDKDPEGAWVVTLMAPAEPERMKLLTRTKDGNAAQMVYNEVKKHYEKRAEAEKVST